MDLAERKEKYKKEIEAYLERKITVPKQIDNSSLRAGAPMTYYCALCGHVKAVMAEEHTEPVPRRCSQCEFLFSMEVMDETGKIREKEVQYKTCPECNGEKEVWNRRRRRHLRCMECAGKGKVEVKDT